MVNFVSRRGFLELRVFVCLYNVVTHKSLTEHIYKQDSENEDAKQEKPEEVGGVW